MKGIKALPVVVDDDLDFVSFHPGIDTVVVATAPRVINQDIFVGARTIGFDKKGFALRSTGSPEMFLGDRRERKKAQQECRYMAANSG